MHLKRSLVADKIIHNVSVTGNTLWRRVCNLLVFLRYVYHGSENVHPDATNSQIYYLTFTRMYSSACFGRPHAHHRELNHCSSSLWFYRCSVVITMLLGVGGPAGPRPTAWLPARYNGRTRGCYCRG
jgi:hypothetical protein